MEMDGGDAKSHFGGSNKRARTAAASEWDSQVFSDGNAEADVRTKLGAATLSGAARNARTAGSGSCHTLFTLYHMLWRFACLPFPLEHCGWGSQLSEAISGADMLQLGNDRWPGLKIT